MEPTRGSRFGLTRSGGRPRLRIPLSQVDVHELFKRDHDTVIAHFIERGEGPLARSTTGKSNLEKALVEISSCFACHGLTRVFRRIDVGQNNGETSGKTGGCVVDLQHTTNSSAGRINYW